MGVIELGSSNSMHQSIFLHFVTTWLVTQDKLLHPFLFSRTTTY